jgi:ribonuclease HI
LIAAPSDGIHAYIDWVRDAFRFFRIVPRTPRKWLIDGVLADLDVTTKPILLDRLAEVWTVKLADSLVAMHHWPPDADLHALHAAYEKADSSARRLMAQYLTGTIYTRARAHKFDATISPTCPVCGNEDTVSHRLHACDAADGPLPERGSVVPRLRPLVDWKFPLDTDPKYYLVHVSGPSVCIDRVFDPLDFNTGNPIFTDGSFKHSGTPNALSAGAVVTLASGTPLDGTYHAVGLLTSPALQHSSFKGEVTGLIAALEITAASRRVGQQHTIYCDNLSAVTGINRLLRDQTCRWRRRWDGLWAHVLTEHQAWHGLTLLKVKAHQQLTSDTLATDAALIVGNMIADKIANKLVDYYTPNGLPTMRENHAVSVTPLLNTVARLLAIRNSLPAVPRPSRQVAFARHRAKLAVDRPHRLAWSQRGARCSQCYRHFRTSKGWNGQCSGSPSASVGVLEAAKGKRHNLAIFAMAGSSAGLLVACLRCACFSQFHLCGLNQTCPGHVGTRGAFLRRLLAGRHPTDMQSHVQHVLRPWPRTNRQQRASFDIPAAYVASSSLAPPSLPVASADTAASSSSAPSLADGPLLPIPAEHVEPTGPGPPPPEAPVPPDEEWDLDQLTDWFGESGL